MTAAVLRCIILQYDRSSQHKDRCPPETLGMPPCHVFRVIPATSAKLCFGASELQFHPQALMWQSSLKCTEAAGNCTQGRRYCALVIT